MNIIPAIDIIGGRAVRLQRGDYDKMTVYGENPSSVAAAFEREGAKMLHVVDLDGAKNGTAANFETVKKIIDSTGLSVEVGGGIRNIETVKKYIAAGADRIIIGTSAVTDKKFLSEAVKLYGDKIVVGVDVKQGFVAIKGWLELSRLSCVEFCGQLCDMGIKTVICTDISKDGMLSGTNTELYRELSRKVNINIIASGGVCSVDGIRELAALGLYGAVVGKALYTGAMSLGEAIAAAEV